jgi:hypothetical protein
VYWAAQTERDSEWQLDNLMAKSSVGQKAQLLAHLLVAYLELQKAQEMDVNLVVRTA